MDSHEHTDRDGQEDELHRLLQDILGEFYSDDYEAVARLSAVRIAALEQVLGNLITLLHLDGEETLDELLPTIAEIGSPASNDPFFRAGDDVIRRIRLRVSNRRNSQLNRE